MTENRDTPRHLLSINFLSTGKLMKHSTERFPYGILRHCQTKNFDRKSWYFLPPPTSSHPKFFSIPGISETLGGSPPKFFGTVRQKIFDGKSWYPPPPLLSIKFLATGSWWNIAQKGSPMEFFGTVRQNFWQKTVILPRSSHLPPLFHDFFRYLKLVKL